MRRAGGRDGGGRRALAWVGIGSGPLVRRWIGVRRRRAARTRPDERAGAEIVTLTWAQTFGRDAERARADRARGAGADGPGWRIVDPGEGRPGS
ncbi:hypothetical protein [Methylobacterium platani]|uniref:Uncharacterized protein n=2 Tax=Methylobacterium platani TaxID=427683 RepID=A0A179SBX6_9HYPH|nr:hypothetical protein [Methylobacterium platani]KMO20477.1 hypothetical protein SQ03_05515 [Methylobacterium platani JCM 14648]OAS25308.1 hypothetical protein A5481_10375 [Methylobacterium platani]